MKKKLQEIKNYFANTEKSVIAAHMVYGVCMLAALVLVVCGLVHIVQIENVKTRVVFGDFLMNYALHAAILAVVGLTVRSLFDGWLKKLVFRKAA